MMLENFIKKFKRLTEGFKPAESPCMYEDWKLDCGFTRDAGDMERKFLYDITSQ